MEYLQITILLIFITSCKTNYEGIKRIETMVDYRSVIYGELIKEKKWKRKVEYRIYDKSEKLIETGRYGESHIILEPNRDLKDSTVQPETYYYGDYSKLDHVVFLTYDEAGRIVEKTSWKCRDNKIIYLEYQETFNYGTGTMICTSYKHDGAIKDSSNHKLRTPLISRDATQTVSIVSSTLVWPENKEFIYDNRKKLTKVLYKGNDDNLLGFTKYKYLKLKKLRKHTLSQHP